MLVLTPHVPGRRAWLFGVGLVGAAIARHYLARTRAAQRNVDFPWQDELTQHQVLAALFEAAGRELGASGRLDIIWAAGRAGFGADEASAAAERATFERVTSALAEHARARPGLDVRLHFIGSAGGLFEGRRRVEADTAPRPLRPYGHLKLAQEQHLLAQDGFRGVGIYRLTSVFGYLVEGQRRGLVTTLIGNALKGRVTHLVGDLTTLRDYTFTEDIAAFVAARAISGAARREVTTLAAGRAASIHEVQGMVVNAVGRKLFVAFEPARGNRADITFSPRVAPADWCAGDLRTQIRQVCLQARYGGAFGTQEAALTGRHYAGALATADIN